MEEGYIWGMEKIDRQILMEILIEIITTNARTEALISTMLNQTQKEEFNDKVEKYHRERILMLLKRYGEFLSDEDSDFLKSLFDLT